MGSAIPTVIDYLLTLRDAAVVASGLTGVQASDGWPANLGRTMFGVGIDTPPVTPTGIQAGGTEGILTLGNVGIEETFTVPHYIYDATGGTDQKSCRDAVFSLFNPWIEQLRTDLLDGSVPCLVAMVSDVQLSGPRSIEEAEQGRYAVLSWNVACKNIF